MASSTIPNSAGPGSSIELSEVTIAVRDKVIEKFADEPLEKMNESVKMLLNNEEDEQKRLGILAARVYILRQRIVKLSEGEASYYAARRGWETSPPNGESLKDVSIRVDPFIKQLPDHGNILVVSHGNTIRAISVLFGVNTQDNVKDFEIKVGTVFKV